MLSFRGFSCRQVAAWLAAPAKCLPSPRPLRPSTVLASGPCRRALPTRPPRRLASPSCVAAPCTSLCIGLFPPQVIHSLKRGSYHFFVVQAPFVAPLMFRLASEQNAATRAVAGGEKSAFAWCACAWLGLGYPLCVCMKCMLGYGQVSLHKQGGVPVWFAAPPGSAPLAALLPCCPSAFLLPAYGPSPQGAAARAARGGGCHRAPLLS